MSQTKVKKLTPKQAALIPVYREKWRGRSLSTGLINRSQAAETIKSAYSAIGKKAPEIIFVDRAYEAADIILIDILPCLKARGFLTLHRPMLPK